MSTNTQPRLLTRTTTRRVVHFVTTIREVYSYPTPPRPVIETTGVEVHDSELPSRPRVARCATVTPLRKVAAR